MALVPQFIYSCGYFFTFIEEPKKMFFLGLLLAGKLLFENLLVLNFYYERGGL